MRKPLIWYLVFFSSCDVEPCPILNLHLVANSPIILKSQTLPPLPPPLDQGSAPPKQTSLLPWLFNLSALKHCSYPKIAAMSLPSRWKYMNSSSDCYLRHCIWDFWIPFFWVSFTGSSVFSSHQPTVKLSQASSSSISAFRHYVCAK